MNICEKEDSLTEPEIKHANSLKFIKSQIMKFNKNQNFVVFSDSKLGSSETVCKSLPMAVEVLRMKSFHHSRNNGSVNHESGFQQILSHPYIQYPFTKDPSKRFLRFLYGSSNWE